MNIYKITGYSKCGSYFGSYLQSVTVLAKNEEEALKVYKDWSKTAYSFEKGVAVNIELIATYTNTPTVIDYVYDSDY